MPGVDPISIATAGVGLAQGVSGLINKGKDRKELDKLVNSRQAFHTPDEIYQILNATQSEAGNGLDADTLAYLTGQSDKAFSSAVGASTLLGGDPNDLSALFTQKMQGIMQIGAENHAANLQNFSRYLGALNTVADNKAAEQISADNIIKDKIQAKSAEVSGDTKNINNGLNTVLGGLASNQEMQLFKTPSLPTLSGGTSNNPSGYSPSTIPVQQITPNMSLRIPQQNIDYSNAQWITDLLKNNFIQ